MSIKGLICAYEINVILEILIINLLYCAFEVSKLINVYFQIKPDR